MLYLTCTTITSADLTHYGVSRAKDWVAVDCGTIKFAIVVDVKLVANYNQCRSQTTGSNVNLK